MMIFDIIARNKERTQGYGRLLDRIELLADGRVFCVDVEGNCSFTDRKFIMYNPTIIRQSNRVIYKINLDGSGIPETKRAGKEDNK